MTTAEATAAGAAESGLSSRDEKRAQRIAKNVKAFAAAHGGSAEGVVEYVGTIATRIALVAADGAWGDQVAPSVAIAERAVELSGITRAESFEGELGLKVRTSAYEWRRMAGIQL